VDITDPKSGAARFGAFVRKQMIASLGLRLLGESSITGGVIRALLSMSAPSLAVTADVEVYKRDTSASHHLEFLLLIAPTLFRKIKI
jgi:hypothetical protein